MADGFLRNAWYCAAMADEVDRTPLARTFLNEPVVMYRKQDGDIVALSDACPHRLAPLHKGVVIEDSIRCPYHGLVFNDRGVCVWMPGKGQIPDGARVRRFPIEERHGWVWIWMGDLEHADPALIMDCSPCTETGWTAVCTYAHVECDTLLLVDNLMDLQHVAFVHQATIGNEEDNDPDLKWTSGDGWVSGTRVARDLAPAPALVSFGYDFNRDETKVMRYEVPTNVTVDVKMTEAGCAYGEGRLSSHMIIFNLMTPETASSCHYFSANTRNWLADNEHLTGAIRASIGPLLQEDKDILHAVQQMSERVPDRPLINLRADTGNLRARRMFADHVRAERTALAEAAE